MSDTSLVRAKHTNGEERYIPNFWLGEKSPFPGDWTEVKVPAKKQRETVYVPSILDPEGTEDPNSLKGAALDAALDAAGLPKTGSADDKRQRLAGQKEGVTNA